MWRVPCLARSSSAALTHGAFSATPSVHCSGRNSSPSSRLSMLGLTLVRKSNGRVDGFVVEGPSAGGHNAPPRGAKARREGEPVTDRDMHGPGGIRAPDCLFRLAGSHGRGPDCSRLWSRASGIQVGTAFAFCATNPLVVMERERVGDRGQPRGPARYFHASDASPTGFPFKVLSVPGTVSDANVFEARERICDLGYLRQTYRESDGSLGYRCARAPRGFPAQRRHRSRNARSQVPLQRAGSGRRLRPGASRLANSTCHRDGR